MKKRTSIFIDKDWVQAGLKATGLKTRRELVDLALRDLIRRESQKRMLELKGRIDWEGDFQEMRKGRTFS